MGVSRRWHDALSSTHGSMDWIVEVVRHFAIIVQPHAFTHGGVTDEVEVHELAVWRDRQEMGSDLWL